MPTAGVEVCAGHLAHEQDDNQHHQPRCRHRRAATDRVGKGLPHHPATSRDEHQEEDPEQLGDQPPLLTRSRTSAISWTTSTSNHRSKRPATVGVCAMIASVHRRRPQSARLATPGLVGPCCPGTLIRHPKVCLTREGLLGSMPAERESPQLAGSVGVCVCCVSRLGHFCDVAEHRSQVSRDIVHVEACGG